MHVTVLGTGTIGSTVAYNLAVQGVTVRVTDVDETKSRGHALDVAHSLAHATHPVGQGLAAENVQSVSPGVGAVTDTDCIVMTASAPRPTGANQRGGRTEWLNDNLDIVGEISDWLRDVPPCPVVVVTNPVDIITYELYRQSSWPSRWFLGYSLSETARLGYILAREFDVRYEDVSCPVLGEHGENMVPMFSQATIRGERLTLDDTRRQTILDRVRDVPYRVMDLRGAQESSRWVTGRGTALVAQKLLSGGIDEPVGLSTPLNGEYGYKDVALSVPVTFDDTGIKDIVNWELSTWEQSRMDNAYRAVVADIPE